MLDHALIGDAKHIPTNAATQVLSIHPVTLSVPGRAVDLQLRITLPATGSKLPVLLFSHGHGHSNNLSSLNGYGPAVNFWAAHGLAVIQPTHLSSKSLGLDTPDAPLFWRSRAADMTAILDQLAHIESSTPLLSGRLDPTRIAIAGHSMGAHTTCLLLGMRLTDPQTNTLLPSTPDPRITTGIVIAGPGNGGDDLSPYAHDHYPVMRHPDFTTMTTPALVVAGSADVSPHLSTRGADWHEDPYTLAPGPKTLLTLPGAEHALGGIPGYDAAETTDESVERVAVFQRLTTAFLHSALDPADKSWERALVALQAHPHLASVTSK